jgi:alpha-tubulin suppressor-like RCC1 family protein
MLTPSRVRGIARHLGALLVLLGPACSYGAIRVSENDAGAGASRDGAVADSAIVDGGALPSGSEAGPAADAQADDDDSGMTSSTALVPVELVSGLAHSCVRFADGRVKCWGANDRGQLGLGDTAARGDEAGEMADALPFVDLGSGLRAKGLAAGFKHTCAMLLDGSVKCWGRNSLGQLGLGTGCVSECTTAPVFDHRGDEPAEMGAALPAVDLAARAAVTIRARGDQTCALLDDETVRCWGSNTAGALGLTAGCSGNCGASTRGDEPGEMGSALMAVDLGADRHAIALDVGFGFVLALLDDGSIRGWGANDVGQLGVGDELTRGDDEDEMGDGLPRVLLPAGTTAKHVFAGGALGCAALADGDLHCWGGFVPAPHQGEPTRSCATGGSMPCTTRLELQAAGHAASVAIGGDHACMITLDGELRCWGSNYEGQLGLGSTDTRGDEPGELAAQPASAPLGAGRRYLVVSAGTGFSCGVIDDASVRCWGSNALGQLGLGDTQTRGISKDFVTGVVDLGMR